MGKRIFVPIGKHFSAATNQPHDTISQCGGDVEFIISELKFHNQTANPRLEANEGDNISGEEEDFHSSWFPSPPTPARSTQIFTAGSLPRFLPGAF